MKPTRAVKGMLLYPGAGTDSNHSSLVLLESALAPLPVRRADFGYRKAGRRAPDRTPVLLDAVRAEAGDFAASLRVTTSKIVFGGRSMGGRMCSIAIAGEAAVEGVAPPAAPVPAAALVLIAYPLHPPGKPDKLRTEHLPRLDLPCLFISGTKDPFGTPDEMLRWTSTIAGPVTHVWFDGRGHDLKGCDRAIADAVADWLSPLR